MLFRSAESEMQAARVDDDRGVEPVNGRFVREPGGRQRCDGAADFCVMPDGQGEEVRRSGFRLASAIVVSSSRGVVLWATRSSLVAFCGGRYEIAPCGMGPSFRACVC